MRGGKSGELADADISVTVAEDVSGNRFDAVGINNIGGELTFTGDKTTITVRQYAKTADKNEGNIGATGYLSIDSGPHGHAVVTNFNAGKTVFDIENTVEGEDAIGIVSASNDPTRPEVNVAGDLDVKVKSATGGTAIGVYSIYTDFNLDGDPSDGGPTIDNPGHIKVAKNLTVEAVGGDKAFGVSADIGEVVVEGDTHITATATSAGEGQKPDGNVPANGAYGIYVSSNGHATFKGNETVVTAEKALWLTKE